MEWDETPRGAPDAALCFSVEGVLLEVLAAGSVEPDGELARSASGDGPAHAADPHA